jgi:hypothetical protein
MPRRASIDKRQPARLGARSYPQCPDGGIGRRTSFRCWRSQGRGGSSPLPGTSYAFQPISPAEGKVSRSIRASPERLLAYKIHEMALWR